MAEAAAAEEGEEDPAPAQLPEGFDATLLEPPTPEDAGVVATPGGLLDGVSLEFVRTTEGADVIGAEYRHTPSSPFYGATLALSCGSGPVDAAIDDLVTGELLGRPRLTQ